MNDIIKTMIERRSIRSYKPDQVTDSQLQEVIEAGRYAASGNGRQPVLFIAIQDKENRELVRKMNAEVMQNPNSDPYYGAPTIILVLASPESRTYIEDGNLAIGNLMNAAHSLGLASVYVYREREMFASEDGQALLKKWGVEGTYEGIGSVALGYAACDLPAAAPRKDNVIILK